MYVLLKHALNMCFFCCQQPYYLLWLVVNKKFTAFLIDLSSQQISCTCARLQI